MKIFNVMGSYRLNFIFDALLILTFAWVGSSNTPDICWDFNEAYTAPVSDSCGASLTL